MRKSQKRAGDGYARDVPKWEMHITKWETSKGKEMDGSNYRI
jgi:hypothetical protein